MKHWKEQKEQKGSIRQMKFLFFCYKFLGEKVFRILLYPIVFFFHIFASEARKSSRQFFQTWYEFKGLHKSPGFRESYWHFYSFSHVLVEKLAAWSGHLSYSKPELGEGDNLLLRNDLEKGRGAVILCSHLGNTEMLRAYGSMEAGRDLPPFKIYSLVDFSGTARFNAFLKEINPASMVRLVDVNGIDPSVIIKLKDALDQGGLVVIAADRTTKAGSHRNASLSFLGHSASFPQGSFILANLLDAPVYHMFALRKDDFNLASPYVFHVYRAQSARERGRGKRNEAIKNLSSEFLGHLEKHCLEHPYQWFNFFDFWNSAGKDFGKKREQE